MTSWTVAHQAPLSMGISRQEYWSGLPFPFPGDLSNPRIKLTSPTLAARFFTVEPSGKPCYNFRQIQMLRQFEGGLEKNFQTQSISEGSEFIKNKQQR